MSSYNCVGGWEGMSPASLFHVWTLDREPTWAERGLDGVFSYSEHTPSEPNTGQLQKATHNRSQT